MNNPWNDIELQTSEAHIQRECVQQLQTLDSIMEEQFALCDAKQVMILESRRRKRPAAFEDTCLSSGVWSGYKRRISAGMPAALS